MKFRLLPAISLLSLALLGALSCGYFGDVAVVYVSVAAGGTVPPLVHVTAIVGVDGRVEFLNVERPSSPALRASLKPGIHSITRLRPPFRRPSFRGCLWGFDCDRANSQTGTSIFILAFPIWCAALPLLVAPALWLLRRRKRCAEPPGFGVIQQHASRGLGAV